GEGCASRVEGITTKRRRCRNPSRAPYSFNEAPDSACRVPRFFSRARVKFTGTRRVLLVRESKYVERHCSRVALDGLSVGFHLGAWEPTENTSVVIGGVSSGGEKRWAGSPAIAGRDRPLSRLASKPAMGAT